MPARSLDGLMEREIALLIHRSALESDSDAAQQFRSMVPRAMLILSQGRLEYREVRPLGYIRNAVFVSLLSLLVFCVVRGRTDLWLGRLTKAIGPPQRDPTVCKGCGYDLRGLERCPECGRAQ